MLRGLALFLSLPAFAANVQLFTSLPNGATTNVIQLDSAGNIYLAGSYLPPNPQFTNAFAAKLSADGSQIVYFTAIGGSQNDVATALAVGPDGSVYVAGFTASGDFPVTPGAFQTNPAAGGSAFLTRLNPSGAITYASFVGGNVTQITGMLLDSAGDLDLTGLGGPGYTDTTGPPQGFILELDPSLTKVLLSVYGYGGGLLRLDSQGNIYVAGSAQPNVSSSKGVNVFTLPSFPQSAFQPNHASGFCETFGSGPGGPGGSLFCRYQYVAKLTHTGSLIWGTYVTGTYGAIVRGMAVDSAGNVIVAGTTLSDDYPVTSGAFQTVYTSSGPPFANTSGNGYKPAPPAIGFVTKINSTGTGLLWSTYFGGSFADSVNGLAVNSAGEIFISGRAGSSDLPGLEGIPDGCHPGPLQLLGFVARLSPDGATAGPAQPIAGAPDCTFGNCSTQSDYPSYSEPWPLAIRSDGVLVTAGTAGTVASVNFAASSRVVCFVDPADNLQLRSVAPGQLLTLFGNDLAPDAPFTPPGGVAPSTANFGITFNGTPAPILYSSAGQINIQVPYEIAGLSTVQMQITDNQTTLPLSESHTLGVVARQPSIFLSPAALESQYPGYSFCNNLPTNAEAALVLNADGTVNSCANPAVAGSTVTLFVNGLGQVSPALATGAIEPSPAIPLTPAVTANQSNLASAFTATTSTIPGSISGIAQLQVTLPPSITGGEQGVYIVPQLSGTAFREIVLVWTVAAH